MTKENEMAFPCQSRWDSGNESMDLYPDNRGLTKREYFAAMAMQGMTTEDMTYAEIASSAVKFADALIDALNANNT